MKLTKVRITNFQSIQDSTEFDIDDITCLVGKNESGKTALLKSLYRLNPINEIDSNFNVTDDYPRRTMITYEDEIAEGRQEPAQVVQATYELEPVDIVDFKESSEYVFKDETPTITLRKGYSNELELVYKDSSVKIGKFMYNNFNAEELINNGSSTGIGEFIPNGLNVETAIFLKHIVERIPKFFYFDEYYQMEGRDNIDALRQREANNTLKESDYPLLGLIHLAGLNLNQIIEPRRTEDLIARLEASSNSLTQKVLPYWSQNQHLEMEFDIRQGYPDDPPDMRSGTNILGRVRNTKHGVTTALGTRSRGFVWFFSFLAWYQDLRKRNENLILLLDEPGLFLHAKAQGDLLRYFKQELALHHQLIYTTHSPFMVDPRHFDRVRIVQDLSIELDSDDLSTEQQGTKVITEVLEAIPDSLFPLQGALGYEIYQTLFIGPNSLVVEGVSDLLYIQTISALLQQKGKTGLNPDWTITPVGSSDKVPTFVALLGANTNLNIAVLIEVILSKT